MRETRGKRVQTLVSVMWQKEILPFYETRSGKLARSSINNLFHKSWYGMTTDVHNCSYTIH